jgi:hypothetical protein
MSNMTEKERFLRDVLIPTGALTEVLTRVMPLEDAGIEAEDVDVLIWQPLNLTALYVLTSRELPFPSPLSQAVRKLARLFASVLEGLRDGDPHYYGVTIGVFPEELTRLSLEIYSQLGVTPRTLGEWLNAHRGGKAPYALRCNLNCWRVFSRNFAPGEAMKGFKLPEFADLADGLFKEAEHRMAIEIWEQCFDKPFQTLRKEALPMPPNIGVVLLDTGFFEVTAILDPKRMLDWSGAGLAELPDNLAKKMAVQRKVMRCSYATLVGAVQECEQWLNGIRENTPALQAEYNAYVESQSSRALMDKLKEQFSDDEIAVLRRQMLHEARATA